MAPESERANVDKVTVEERWYKDGRIERKVGDGEWEMTQWPQNPPFVSVAEPTLTCSEVVERLPSKWLDQWHEDNGYALCGFYNLHDLAEIKQKLAKLLTIYQKSWRERRVQELEAAIRNFGYWLDEDQVSMWCKVCDAGKGTQHARIYGVDTKDWGPCPVGQAEESEQIRKGAKHESDL